MNREGYYDYILRRLQEEREKRLKKSEIGGLHPGCSMV